MSVDISSIPAIGRPKVSLTQIATEELRRLLGNPPFSAGSQLPSEPELALAMGVSRATLRSALKNLEAEGMILRRPGVGTFVSRLPVLQNNLNVNSGVDDMIRAIGLRPGLGYLDIEVEPADELAANRLQLSAKALTVSIERVRTADGEPVVYSLDIFSKELLDRCSDLDIDQLDDLLRAEGSLYRIFEKHLDLCVIGGVARLKPVIADDNLAERLHVVAGTPLLYLEQVDHDWEQSPLLLSLEYHVSDLCTFIIHRKK